MGRVNYHEFQRLELVQKSQLIVAILDFFLWLLFPVQ